MPKYLGFNIFEIQETKLPVRLINTTMILDYFKDTWTRDNSTKDERGYRRCYSELDNMSLNLHFLDETRGFLLFSKVLGAVNTRGYLRAENRVWSDQEDHEDRGSKDRAESTCGPHSDSFNDKSRSRRSNSSTNNFQTPCRSKS
ncbi:hypothetical protein TNCV_4237611 [Trichonephila clavipes]|nr:hypothetical protein TNCV_4237611 [Trichonephila clavipes]